MMNERRQRIMIPPATAVNAGKNSDSDSSAAPRAALELAKGPIDPDLQHVIDRWFDLPDAVRAGMLAMVHEAEGTR